MLTMIATPTKGPPQTQRNVLEGTIRPTRTHVTQGPLHYEKEIFLTKLAVRVIVEKAEI